MVEDTQEMQPGNARRSWLHMLQPVWSLAILALFAFFAWRQREEVSHAYRALRLADWRWLLLIVVSAVLVHGAATRALTAVIARIGPRVPFLPALMTHFEREMVATVMPFGGAASFVTLVQRFRVYGVTRSDAMLAVLLYSVVGHLSFIAVAIPAMLLLVVQHNADGPILIGAAVVLLTVLLVLLLVAALLRGRQFGTVIESRLPAFVQEFRHTARALDIPARTLLPPFALSVGADLFGVFSVWAALHAVRVETGLLIALVAYTVGTILLLAAPVFQGLGVVEVSVIYLLGRFGIPLPPAIGATILYRFVDVWLPVIFGIGVHARYQRVLRGLPAYLPALWTALTGVLTLASVLPRRFHVPLVDLHRAAGFEPLHHYHVNRTIALVAGFLLLVLAIRLLRRQYAAWVVALVLSSVLTVVYLLRPIDDIGILFTGANIILLLIYRVRFRVRSDIPSLRRGLYVLATSFSATYLYGVLTLWLADKAHFGREFSFVSSLRVAFAILQPIIWRRRVQRAEMEHARRLIEHYGTSSLDRFKYWPDKHQFFATGDKGVASYGLSGRMALVLGDPSVMSAAAFAETLDEFLDFCDLNGWEPAFHQVPPAHLDAYRRRGFTPVMIGQEAIVSLDTFTLSGKSMGSLRSMRNRAQREGLRVEFVAPPLSDELICELKAVSDAWLTLEGRRERTFTLGQFDPAYLRESPVLVLRSADGRAEAFVNLIPDGAPGEMTLDLMRHRVDAPNGSMDLLLLAMIDHGRAQGCTSMSLGMVPFVTPEIEDVTATMDRAIARLARPMGRFFASESLFTYKNKFHPAWEPRYLVVRSVAQLPRAVLALTRLTEIGERGPLRRISRGSGLGQRREAETGWGEYVS